LSASLERALGEVLLDVESHDGPRADGQVSTADWQIQPAGGQVSVIDTRLPVADEQTQAAVLVALYEAADGELHVVLTKRRADLRRHAGEISFPGGRRDPEDATLADTALRETEEEIGLTRVRVKLVGALERTSTFATKYAIHPFVGLIDGQHTWRASASEVERVLEPSLREVAAGRTRTEIERRGFRFETDAYVFDGQLVWGATARILESLLARIEPLLDRRAV
jgi:8-oxo-dGTP pyrophosphatase MutT (NUDIX family)